MNGFTFYHLVQIYLFCICYNSWQISRRLHKPVFNGVSFSFSGLDKIEQQICQHLSLFSYSFSFYFLSPNSHSPPPPTVFRLRTILIRINAGAYCRFSPGGCTVDVRKRARKKNFRTPWLPLCTPLAPFVHPPEIYLLRINIHLGIRKRRKEHSYDLGWVLLAGSITGSISSYNDHIRIRQNDVDLGRSGFGP